MPDLGMRAGTCSGHVTSDRRYPGMTDQSISAPCSASTEVQFAEYLRPVTDAICGMRTAALPVSGRGHSTNAVGAGQFSTESGPECSPAVATLIAAAIATFDADRSASRRYLLRTSAILEACAPHEQQTNHEAGSRGGLALWQVIRIVDYIEEHLAEKITGDDLAVLIDVSIGQLFRAFKASVGVPPLQYVASRRLEFACLRLRTTQEPLSQIAVSAGFCDQSHLCRAFRRALGVTPAAWRRASATGPYADLVDWR